jgi:hypothetical protein
MKFVDWANLEKIYITSDISYRQMEKEYDVSFSAIKDYASKEKWVQKRKDYQKEVASKALQATMANDIAAMTTVRKNLVEAARLLTDIIAGDLRDCMYTRPIDLLNYSQALKNILDLVPAEETSDDDTGGVVYLPERTDGEYE